MPDDCGLKPPIETLPQIAQERAMGPRDVVGRQAPGRSGPSGAVRYHGPRAPPRHGPRPAQRGSRRVPTDRPAGRSLVTRRAIVDIVRGATLGSYGVTGFAGDWPDRPPRAARERPGRPARLARRRDARDRARPPGRPRPADRRGRSPGGLGGPLRHPAALGREVDRLTIHVDGLELQPGRRAAAPPPAARAVDLADSGRRRDDSPRAATDVA